MTNDSIKLVDKKVCPILDFEILKNSKDVRCILGIVQYYRYLWKKIKTHTCSLIQSCRKIKSEETEWKKGSVK